MPFLTEKMRENEEKRNTLKIAYSRKKKEIHALYQSHSPIAVEHFIEMQKICDNLLALYNELTESELKNLSAEDQKKIQEEKTFCQKITKLWPLIISGDLPYIQQDMILKDMSVEDTDLYFWQLKHLLKIHQLHQEIPKQKNIADSLAKITELLSCYEENVVYAYRNWEVRKLYAFYKKLALKLLEKDPTTSCSLPTYDPEKEVIPAWKSFFIDILKERNGEAKDFDRLNEYLDEIISLTSECEAKITNRKTATALSYFTTAAIMLLSYIGLPSPSLLSASFSLSFCSFLGEISLFTDKQRFKDHSAYIFDEAFFAELKKGTSTKEELLEELSLNCQALRKKQKELDNIFKTIIYHVTKGFTTNVVASSATSQTALIPQIPTFLSKRGIPETSWTTSIVNLGSWCLSLFGGNKIIKTLHLEEELSDALPSSPSSRKNSR